MAKHCLGDIKTAENLIKDLYIDLRTKVNYWSKITNQTPQARMGYIGQHLVSVVTGYPGGKSGARGHDLLIGKAYGEIKTCYRVDQLGTCNNCGNVVSSLETNCSSCGSDNIERKNDSKWLINIKNDTEFANIINPLRYYFVLFEFSDVSNNEIQSIIWEVNPLNKGFAFCMTDYYLNIREKSESKAPFDMWPYSLKFLLTKPKLIYKAILKDDGTINTIIFPTSSTAYFDELKPLTEYSASKTLKVSCLNEILEKYSVKYKKSLNKSGKLELLEDLRTSTPITNDELCDLLADNIYLPLILPKKDSIPSEIRSKYPELK